MCEHCGINEPDARPFMGATFFMTPEGISVHVHRPGEQQNFPLDLDLPMLAPDEVKINIAKALLRFAFRQSIAILPDDAPLMQMTGAVLASALLEFAGPDRMITEMLNSVRDPDLDQERFS